MADLSDSMVPEVGSLPDEWDVIVIGAGVLGAFHTYFARLKGLRTLLIERGVLPTEASVRNFGTLVPSAMEAGVWLNRAIESVRTYRQLSQQVSIPLKCEGTQYLATSPAEWAVVKEFADDGRKAGYQCQLLDESESARLNPAIDPRNGLGSLHFPDDARIEPRRFFSILIPWMQRDLGCSYLSRTTVVDVSASGGSVRVGTAAGRRFSARHVFVCCGADLRTLFPNRLAAAGLVRCKLQMLRTVARNSPPLSATIASGLSLRWYPSFRICKSWQGLREESHDPELTRRGIHVLMVQDADGSVVIGDSHEYSSGDLDDQLSARTEALILREARRLARLELWEVAERWHGIYALHPEMPLFQQTLEGCIHLITGIGGKGMTTGPAVARESIDRIA